MSSHTPARAGGEGGRSPALPLPPPPTGARRRGGSRQAHGPSSGGGRASIGVRGDGTLCGCPVHRAGREGQGRSCGGGVRVWSEAGGERGETQRPGFPVSAKLSKGAERRRASAEHLCFEKSPWWAAVLTGARRAAAFETNPRWLRRSASSGVSWHVNICPQSATREAAAVAVLSPTRRRRRAQRRFHRQVSCPCTKVSRGQEGAKMGRPTLRRGKAARPLSGRPVAAAPPADVGPP